MKQELKQLQKENKRIRSEISNLLLLNIISYHKLMWDKINKLIENEIKQEELCNE